MLFADLVIHGVNKKHVPTALVKYGKEITTDGLGFCNSVSFFVLLKCMGAILFYHS